MTRLCKAESNWGITLFHKKTVSGSPFTVFQELIAGQGKDQMNRKRRPFL